MTSEGGLGVALVVAGLGHAVFTAALWAWARWVAERRGGGWHRATLLPPAGLATSLLGAGLSTSLLVRAFRAVATVDAAQKAAVLADGISTAMWASAPFLLLAPALYVASLALSVSGTVLPIPRAPDPSADR